LTRHRDKAEVFVARNTAPNLKELARQMARVDNRKAASHFYQSGDDNSGETVSQSAAPAGPGRAGSEPNSLQADLEAARRSAEEDVVKKRHRDRGGGRSL